VLIKSNKFSFYTKEIKYTCILPHFALLFNTLTGHMQRIVLMDGEFGNDIITISDDDGNVFMLEHIDTIESDGVYYVAFLPADLDEDDENYGLVILKAIEEDGEESFVSIDDESLRRELHKRFIERIENE